MFKYLWDNNPTFWGTKHLEFVIKSIYEDWDEDLMAHVLRSNTTHTIFRSNTGQERILFIQKILHDDDINDEMASFLIEWPYAPAILYLVGGNWPNHPNQEAFFERALAMSSKADLIFYGESGQED